MSRYWIGVVSKNHVQKALDGGFAQVCHGKKGPLLNLSAGDWFIYYSPKLAMDSHEKCQAFTALGTVKDGKVYQVEQAPSFNPYRVDIHFTETLEVPIASIKGDLSFTKSRSYGMLFRRGFFEILKYDFDIISNAMGVTPVS